MKVVLEPVRSRQYRDDGLVLHRRGDGLHRNLAQPSLSDLTDTALVPVELAVRKGRITKDKAFDFLESLAELAIQVKDLSRTEVFVSVRALAERHRLTSYDAAYLELAVRHRLPLAALDADLNKAALAGRREIGSDVMSLASPADASRHSSGRGLRRRGCARGGRDRSNESIRKAGRNR